MLISAWARHQALPPGICGRIESHLRITWEATRGIDTGDILSGFPDRLRADIAMHLVGSIIRSVPLFQGCDEGFLNTLVPLLRHELVCVMVIYDYVVFFGHFGGKMVWIGSDLMRLWLFVGFW
jgi:hypothetical protein